MSKTELNNCTDNVFFLNRLNINFISDLQKSGYISNIISERDDLGIPVDL